MSAGNLHIAWGELVVASLARAGIREAVVSPGSRSTPLVLALANEPSIRSHVVIDERSAAFFALGQVRITGRPTLLLCTSGTAAAHYLPALIEANLCGLPLVVLTADRPWDAYECGAAQTIDQVKLFGDQVRRYLEVGLPDPSEHAMRAAVRIAAQAVAIATGASPGPVHVDARFRKPLEPLPIPATEPWRAAFDRVMSARAPLASMPSREPDAQSIAWLRDALARARRPIIVGGPMQGAADGERLRTAVRALAMRAGAPVLAEGTSQLRFGFACEEVCSFGAFDAVLRDRGTRDRFDADLVIQIGRAPTSAGYASWLAEHANVERYVVAPHGWSDPNGGARAMVFADPASVAERLADGLERVDRGAWIEHVRALDSAAWGRIARELEAPRLTEAVIAHRVIDSLPAETVLAIGNSSPVRDVDTFCPPSTRALTVLHQRGASGIDGLVSGAAGARSVVDAPVVLLLGDVSALHDIGGLHAARAVPGPFVVVIVQNEGGRIFEELPLGAHRELSATFDRFFVTTPSVRFDRCAAAFGFDYTRVESAGDLVTTLRDALRVSAHVVIEAVVTRGVLHRANLWRDVARAVSS